METFPHLRNAPIKEAVLNISIEPPSTEFSHLDVRPFCDAVREEFPEATEIRTFAAEFRFTGKAFRVGEGQQSSETIRGYLCWNSDRTRGLQARVDGLSVNHVKRYGEWSDLIQHAHRGWEEYTRLVPSARVARCSVRFINQLAVENGQDLQEIVNTRPEIAPKLPQGVAEYLMRTVTVVPNEEALVTMTQRLPSPRANEPRQLTIDIDVTKSMPADVNSATMWDVFEKLRIVKNQFFFNSVAESKWKEYL